MNGIIVQVCIHMNAWLHACHKIVHPRYVGRNYIQSECRRRKHIKFYVVAWISCCIEHLSLPPQAYANHESHHLQFYLYTNKLACHNSASTLYRIIVLLNVVQIMCTAESSVVPSFLHSAATSSIICTVSSLFESSVYLEHIIILLDPYIIDGVPPTKNVHSIQDISIMGSR